MKIKMPEKPNISRRTVTMIIFVTSMGLLIGLAIFGFFSVQTVRSFKIDGESRYTDEALIELSGIEYGSSLYGFDCEQAAADILEGAPHLREVRVRVGLFSTVVIEVVEDKAKYFACIADEYFLMSEDFRILESSRSSELYEELAVRITLPGVSVALVGQKIEFTDEKTEALVERFITEVENMNFGSYGVTAIGLEDKFYGVYIVLDGRLKIIVGDTSSVTLKVETALEYIYRADIKITEGYAQIIVSDSGEAFYSELENIEY